MKSKRKLSAIEWALIIVPITAIAGLACRDSLIAAWNKARYGGIPYNGNWVSYSWSPDGQQLVISSWNRKTNIGQMQWVDAQSQKVLDSQEDDGAGELVWSPDGKLFARTGTQGYSVWDAAAHTKLFSNSNFGGLLQEYTWTSPSTLQMKEFTSQRISAAGAFPPRYKQSISTYQVDVRTQQETELSTPPAVSAHAQQDSRKLSPNGKWKISISQSIPYKVNQNSQLPTSNEGQRVQLWDRTTGKLKHTFEGDMFVDAVFCDNQTVAGFARIQASGGSQQGAEAPPMTYVCAMNINTNSSVWRPLGSSEDGFGFSPKGTFLLAYKNNILRLRSTPNWQIVKEIDAINFATEDIKFSPDERLVAFTSQRPETGQLYIVPTRDDDASPATP